jgi:hypothetical protein
MRGGAGVRVVFVVPFPTPLFPRVCLTPLNRFFFVQVVRIKYKSINPERPLSNVFSSSWSLMTSLQKVSKYQYNLDWESGIRPRCVYISFLR